MVPGTVALSGVQIVYMNSRRFEFQVLDGGFDSPKSFGTESLYLSIITCGIPTSHHQVFPLFVQNSNRRFGCVMMCHIR